MLEPEGTPVGAVVFLHGLTDSPYSLRHIARRYRAHGYVSIAIRLPGHGTVPSGLSDVHWEDWLAATRLAVREARRRIGPSRPLHLVGFSNGGALAMKYALDALEDPQLTRPDRIVLISPKIGITAFARFAGLAGLPALLPHFAKAAWLSILPEFNPFKYNSFPVNGARQTWRMTQALQEQILRLARDGQLAELPPILTFQSVIDFTVSTRAIITSLYVHLPANGSELVLFDLNRDAKLGPLLRSASDAVLDAGAAAAAAPLPHHDHRQCQRRQQRGRGTRDRGRGGYRAGAPAGAVLSARRLFAVACRAAVPAERRSVRLRSRSERGLRHQPGHDRGARRARRSDRQPGHAAAHVVQPVLPVPASDGSRKASTRPAPQARAAQ